MTSDNSPSTWVPIRNRLTGALKESWGYVVKEAMISLQSDADDKPNSQQYPLAQPELTQQDINNTVQAIVPSDSKLSFAGGMTTTIINPASPAEREEAGSQHNSTSSSVTFTQNLSKSESPPHHGMFNNSRHTTILGGVFYHVQGNVSHIPVFAGMDENPKIEQYTGAAPFGNFVGSPSSTGSTWQTSQLGAHQKERLSVITGRLRFILQDPAYYKRLLDSQAPHAQILLDFFQSLLDNPDLDANLRRSIVVAMQRLSRKTNLYPKCFVLGDVALVDDEPITNGNFADIYKGTFQGQLVCLKTVRASQAEHIMKRFTNEAILWGQLSHTNLLPFYGLYQFRSRACLVSPWVDNGHVNEYLDLNPDVDRTLLVLDIAAGMQYLHDEDIVHGDLKGANILVDTSGRACLADFGLSAVTDSQIVHWSTHSYTSSKGGSVRWQAPELNDPEKDEVVHNTKESDVYAWACVCYEIFTGRLPYYEFHRDSTVMSKVINGHRPSWPLATSSAWTKWGLTQSMWALMRDCWKHDPSDRPVVAAIIIRLCSPMPTDQRPGGGWGRNMSPSYFRNTVRGGQHQLSIDDVETVLCGLS